VLRLPEDARVDAVEPVDPDHLAVHQHADLDGGARGIAQIHEIGRQDQQGGKAVEVSGRQVQHLGTEPVAGRLRVLLHETGQRQGAEQAVEGGQR
jgi:hypothetical protein